MNSRKRIRVGVVGVGYLGKLHAQKYSMIEDAELVGVTDSNGDRARDVAASNSTKAFSSSKDLFGLVDAVSIVTPTESHCAVALEFLSRGVDVLVEKPITVGLEEADRLIKEAGRTNSILQVGHIERFNAAIEALNGRVIAPVFMEAYRHSAFPNRSADVDVVLDLMIHDIDIVMNLAGSEVEGVEAVGLPVISDKVDIAKARLRFKNGCVANLSASRVSKERVRKLNIIQPGAFFSVDYANQRLTASRLVPGKDGGLPSLEDEDVKTEKKDALLEELRSFLICSASRRTPVVSGIDGKKALEAAKRIQESIRACAESRK